MTLGFSRISFVIIFYNISQQFLNNLVTLVYYQIIDQYVTSLAREINNNNPRFAGA